MVLDLFGGRGVLENRKVLVPTGYRSAESGQVETSAYDEHGNNTNYEVIYTVTTGKTFFITDIIGAEASSAARLHLIATGESASEVVFLAYTLAADESKHLSFLVPLKLTSATIISWKMSAGSTNNHLTIIGFEE